MSTKLSSDLLAWYAKNARRLPWREKVNPYAVWVSEIMLQQTRVETVIPYFQRWMNRFPTVKSLAQAEIDEVLRIWEGLGYYQRAHNLLRAAKLILEGHGGDLPQSSVELGKLPGIGPYTAAAISSIAFGEAVLALDGNLRRVISRLVNYDQVASMPEAEKLFRGWSNDHISSSSASEFNQALMDLGALICTPRSPKCGGCPISSHCEAYALGLQDERPVRMKGPQIPHYVVSAGVLIKNGKVLIGRRPPGKLLGGLWEFPGGKCHDGERIKDCLVREWKEELNMVVVPGEEIGVIDHAYTHFKVTVHAIACEAQNDEMMVNVHSEVRWIKLDQLEDYPMGKVDRRIADMIGDQVSGSTSKR
jgi:A/G-specific adenine glycosylase